jgi:aryl-alcohol dehydrogenase-like predicted oxidoreductase
VSSTRIASYGTASTNRLPLVLGTAQLGLKYGIANKDGKPNLKGALEIVAEAWGKGIRFFDTARAYGDSERVLGRCFKEILGRKGQVEPAVITKLDPSINLSHADHILKEVETSLENLGVDALWGLMLHRESLLDRWGQPLAAAVAKLKHEKKIGYFGVSVYSPERAIQALKMASMDFIQLPFNVLDQRPLEHGLFELAKKNGKEVFVRSVYLQGLLLLNPDDLPPKMFFAKRALNEFVAVSGQSKIPPRLLAMAFSVQKAPLAHVLVGCETPAQVRENVSLFRGAKTVDLPDLEFLAQQETKIINPSLWPQ